MFALSSAILNEIVVLYLGIVFSVSIFFFLRYISRPEGQLTALSINRSQFPMYFLILTIASAALILYVQPYEESVLNLTQIPPQNWMRLVAALFMSSFFPGYFLLRILDKNKTISGLAAIVVSNLLSILIVFVLHFTAILSGRDSSFSSMMTVGVTVSLAVFCNLVFQVRNRFHASGLKITFNKNEKAVLVALLSVVSLGAFFVMIFDMPLTRSDMWIVHSQALEFSNGFAIDRSTYPYLFQMYLSVLFALSGLHSALTMQTLYFLSFVPVLAFYVMLKKWFAGKDDSFRTKIPMIGTFLSVLLGFGGIFVIYLKYSNPQYGFSSLAEAVVAKTYDSYMRFPFAPYMVILRWSVGLTVLFVLLYFLRMEASHAYLRNAMLAALVFLGYMGHTTEIMFFLGLFIVWEIFFQARPDWRIGFSVLLGLLAVGLADFLAPVKTYTIAWNTFNGNQGYSIPYIISILATTSIVIVDIVRVKQHRMLDAKLTSFGDIARNVREFAVQKWNYLRWIPIYLYFLCVIVWISVIGYYNLWNYGSYSFVPFFLFPVRFGAVGVLAVISIAAFFPEMAKSRTVFFFFVVFAAGIISEQLANYFPFLYADLDRLSAVTNIGASVTAAYGLLRASTAISTGRGFLSRNVSFGHSVSKKNFAAILMLSLLILPGALGTVVYYDHMTYLNDRGQVVSDSELRAFKYIGTNLHRNESVLTLTASSAFKLRTFAGALVQSLYTASDKNVVTSGLLTATDPYVIAYILGNSNTRYVYMAKDDVQLLDSEYHFFESFLKNLPVVFTNEDVRIYEVPKITPPHASYDPKLGVIHFSNYDYSLNFDGSTNYVETEDSALIETQKELTVEISIKKTGDIFYKFPVDKPKANWVSYSVLGTEDQKLQFIIGIDSGTATRNVTTNTALRDNEWYDVVGTYDGTRIAIYLDGRLENESFYEEAKDVYYNNGMPLTLGRHATETASYFKGAIDNVRIYNRTLLEDEITYDYENKTPKNNTGLILRLDLDKNLQDTSENHLEATNHGAKFQRREQYSAKDSAVALLVSKLQKDYSQVTVDQTMTEDLNNFISNYTAIILDSDPKQPPPALLDWVMSGKTLVVLNTNGDGYFSNAVMSNESSTGIFREGQLGSGKVLLCDVHDLIETGAIAGSGIQAEIVVRIGNLTDLTGQDSPQQFSLLPGDNFNMTYGNLSVKGDLTLSSDHLTVIEGSLNLSMDQDNFQAVEARFYGKSNLYLQNVSATVSPDDSYLIIKLENNPVIGRIVIQGSRIVIVTVNNTVVLALDGSPKTIEFSGSNFDVRARLPSVNASGEIVFDSLYIHIAPYTQFAGIVFGQATVKGEVSYSSLYVDQSMVYYSNFVVYGQVLKSTEGNSQLVIPWFDVIGSVYGLAFHLSFFVSVIAYTVKRKRRVTNQAAQ